MRRFPSQMRRAERGGLVAPQQLVPSVSGGWSYFATSLDAHDDGSGKCDSLADRVAGYSFAQSNSAKRYTIDTARNGKKLLYNATGGSTYNKLSLANSTLANLVTGTQSYTVCWYGVKTDSASVQSVWSFNDGATANTSNQHGGALRTSTTTGVQYYRTNASTALTVSQALTGAWSAAAMQLHCWIFDGPNHSIEWSLNGTSQSTSVLTSSISTSAILTTVTLGTEAETAGRLALKGYNGMWGLYLGKMSASDQLTVYSWCAARLGT